MTNYKINYFLAKFTLFITAIFALTILYWVIFPIKTLEIKKVNLNKSLVKRGEHIVVSADYCKYINKQADLFISFIDGVVYNTQPQVINTEKGCRITGMSVYIPKALPEGEFKIKMVFRYKVNPIRVIEVNYLTEEFTIIK